MCHRSAAAGTHVKYKCDSRNLTCTFARSKMSFTEKLTNGALVTPNPGSYNILSPVCHKAVIRTIVDLLPNKPMGKFCEMGFEVHKLLFEKNLVMQFKICLFLFGRSQHLWEYLSYECAVLKTEATSLAHVILNIELIRFPNHKLGLSATYDALLIRGLIEG